MQISDNKLLKRALYLGFTEPFDRDIDYVFFKSSDRTKVVSSEEFTTFEDLAGIVIADVTYEVLYDSMHVKKPLAVMVEELDGERTIKVVLNSETSGSFTPYSVVIYPRRVYEEHGIDY